MEKERAFVTVEYEEGSKTSFDAIKIKWGENVKLFNTGDPVIDWYDYHKFVYGGEAAECGIGFIMCSSSVDHWFMDNEEHSEQFLKSSDDGNTAWFATDEEMLAMDFDDIDNCIKCVIRNGMNSFQELKDYYKNKTT